MEFTEFEYSLGIKDDQASAEYAFILRGLIREIFEKYGIAITRDEEAYEETLNGDFDTPLSLTYKSINTLSISGYVEDIDYTVDKTKGTVTILSSGSMNSGTNYTVSYTYYVFINEYNESLSSLFPNKTFTEYSVPPPDLKYAFYTAAQMRYENMKARTYMISSVTSPEGSKTVYKPFKLPREISVIFEHYSPLSSVELG